MILFSKEKESQLIRQIHILFQRFSILMFFTLNTSCDYMIPYDFAYELVLSRLPTVYHGCIKQNCYVINIVTSLLSIQR